MSKNMIIVAVIVVVVLVGGALLLSQNQKAPQTSQPTPTTTTETATPTQAEEKKEATGATKKEDTSMTKGSTIEVKNFAYVPATLTVKAGEKITYTNRDVAGHSVTSDDGKSFDTGVVGKDQSATLTAPSKPGTYGFHCTPHPNIKATLVVE